MRTDLVDGGPTGPRRKGCWNGLAAAAAVLLLVAGSPCLAGDLLQALSGRWATESGAPFAMDWQPAADGFGLRWTVPGQGEASARFTPAGRPGVLAGRAEGDWSMFGRDKLVNPLVEGTLYWARSTADTIYVYSLGIDDRGGFVLDRYACSPSGDGLAVSLLRRLPQGRAETLEMQLVRVER
jgi:hypothetical protein